MDILHFLTAGSVDDGKSTLIGRLLYDAKAVSHDILHAIERQTKNKANGTVDLSLLTDGLRAEREQGITIDVAYKYFHTSTRKFIIADAPGHVQYTRNMVTAASTADVAIILIDARQGVVEQTHRHTLVAALMGIPHVVVAINKMDMVAYDEQRFYQIAADYQRLLQRFPQIVADFIPLSALLGDNVVERSAHMHWYNGKTLMQYLETVPIVAPKNRTGTRLQVQWVIRPSDVQHHDYRGYAGTLRTGELAVGDHVVVLPAGIETKIDVIEVHQQAVSKAYAGQPVVVQLTDDVDISRGDTLVKVADDNPPHCTQDIAADVCWMHERPLRVGDRYLLQHHAKTVKAIVKEIVHRTDVHTFADAPAEQVGLNDIAHIRLRTAQPLVFDAYAHNRHTGGFILVNPDTFDTAGAGLLHAVPALKDADWEFAI